MNPRQAISLLGLAMVFFTIVSCSKSVPLGRYVAVDDTSDYVELLPDNKIRMIHGGYLFATMDYKISGDKLAVGGGGRFGDQYRIDEKALIDLGTQRRFVYR